MRLPLALSRPRHRDALAEMQTRRFARLYARPEATYGTSPSRELMTFLEECAPAGPALDLGAGLGRNTLALARRGHEVLAVDLSPVGLRRLARAARAEGLGNRVTTRAGDVRDLDLVPGSYGVIVAATILDHMHPHDGDALLGSLLGALAADGVLYVEVHTTEDPGSPVASQRLRGGVASESAAAIERYYAPGELLALLFGRVRVLRYEERLEHDRTHGWAHQHGKALALCVPEGSLPPYFGDAARRP